MYIYKSAASNPFPISQFPTNAVAFFEPGGPHNWSNDLFARKIRDFANNNGITSCGIIAHSQGGLASLTLYTFYWSCLDYSSNGGSRMIQSVGSPYQGTALSDLAGLANFFGFGCGSNNDLTYSGATGWLASIPTWARAKVHYWTTSFTDSFWSYDYCHFATDPFLSDPDDGTVEQSKGQLSGGNNRGHATGQCHTTDMRDAAQYFNSARNSEMNTNARY